MRLNSLHLTNFRQHADSRLEFDLGLTGIVGPNGAGKSTILEAIAWALYGQTAARGTRDSIRNIRAGPRAPVRVELDFDLAGHRYRVVRGLTTAELYLDGGDAPIATTITDVGELLQRRLGMTRSEFFHTYFTGQKELSVMASMAPAERQLFLSRVLGYDRIRAAQGLARERRKLIGAEIDGVLRMMPDARAVDRMLQEAAARRTAALSLRKQTERRRREADAALAVLAPQWEAAQRARDALQQLLSDLRLAENDVASATRELDRVERDLAAIEEARREIETVTTELAPLTEIMEEYQHLENLAREEGRRRTLAETLRALFDELTGVREQLGARAAIAESEPGTSQVLAARRQELEGVTAELEARRTDWVRDRQEAETKRDALRKEYAEIKAQRDRIVDLGEEGICPTCSRVLGEHYRTVFDGIEEQLETIEVDGKYFATRLEQLRQAPAELKALDERRRLLQQEVSDLERQFALAQAAVHDVARLNADLGVKEQRHDQLTAELRAIPPGYDKVRHRELQARMERFAPLNEQLARLGARIESETELRVERERSSHQRTAAEERLATLRKRYEETHFSEEDLQRQRQEYEEAVAALRASDMALTSASGEAEHAIEAMANAERARQELERAQEVHARLDRERLLHDELIRACTDLRTELNYRMRPDLSDLASDYLGELTDGRYDELQIDDQYNITVVEAGIPKQVISGGEEDLLNLAVRLAISQMIAERSGQAFSLLVLDEVFGSLDEHRRLRVVELLRRLLDRFEQIVVMTHIEGTRDDLDHKIRIDYDDRTGESRVWSVDAGPMSIDDLGADLLAAGAES